MSQQIQTLKKKTKASNAVKKNITRSRDLKQTLALLKQFSMNSFTRLSAALQTILKTIKRFFSQLPIWIKSRPNAVKTWFKEDKKKKKYRSFRLQKKIKPVPKYIPSTTQLLKSAFTFLFKNWRVFAVLLIINGTIYFVFLRGNIPVKIADIQSTIKAVAGEGGLKSVRGNITTLGAAIGSSSSADINATVSGLGTILMSLAYIWTIRQLHIKKNAAVHARDAYYQGMTPIIPVLLVLLVLSLQLAPLAMATFLYVTARFTGVFASGFEDLSVFAAAVLVGLLSFYWAVSSIIALYIVTLPGMRPIKALRAAKETVRFQRFPIFKRILSMAVILGGVSFLILLTVVRFIPEKTFMAIAILQLVLLPLIHIILFKLYRALI